MGATKKQGKGGIGSSSTPRQEQVKAKGKGKVVKDKTVEDMEEMGAFDFEEHEKIEVPKKRAPRKAKIPKRVYIDAFNKCEFVQTRWGNRETLASLGILDDVELILKNIGFQDVLGMEHLVFPSEVAQLLGSFELELDFGTPPPIEKLGMVRFFVNGFGYKLTIEELCNAYGFKPTLNPFKLRSNQYKDRLVWKMIGNGVYKPGRAKAGHIGNPGIRYVHKLLAHTLFARKETDRIREDEMALLCNGIKPLQEKEFEREAIRGYEDLNLGIMLARKILYLKKTWVLKERDEPGKVYIGGFLTPLLIASGVPLGIPCSRPRKSLDTNHLLKADFISGKDGDKIVYNFVNTMIENVWVYLPNQDITKVNSLMNIKFLQGEKVVIKEAIDPAPLGRKQKVKCIQGAPRQDGIPLGSSRYYHSSYQGRVQSEATRHALEGVKKNQKLNKWHSRALYNIKHGFKKEIKGLKSQISDLKSMIDTYVLRKKSPPRFEEGSSSYGNALEEARRHSISHLPSHQSANHDDPPRASSYETRAPRRKRRHLPTPSPPSSDNISFHLSDSYSEG